MTEANGNSLCRLETSTNKMPNGMDKPLIGTPSRCRQTMLRKTAIFFFTFEFKMSFDFIYTK